MATLSQPLPVIKSSLSVYNTHASPAVVPASSKSSPGATLAPYLAKSPPVLVVKQLLSEHQHMSGTFEGVLSDFPNSVADSSFSNFLFY